MYISDDGLISAQDINSSSGNSNFDTVLAMQAICIGAL
jgi:hypothetical protein